MTFLGTVPSTICPGTDRPVCQFGDLGTAPTTEHYMPGDWSTSLPVWRLGDCIDQSEHYMLGDWSTSPQFENSGTAPTNLSTICLGTGRLVHNLKIRGLYRPPSVIYAGTGRLVYLIANEHDMLGDWSIGLFNCKRA